MNNEKDRQMDTQMKEWTDMKNQTDSTGALEDLTSGQTSERLYRREQSKGLDKQTNK